MSMTFNGQGIQAYIEQLLIVGPQETEIAARSIVAQAQSLVPVVTGSLHDTIDTEPISTSPDNAMWSVNAGNLGGGHKGDEGRASDSPVDYAADIEYNHTPYMTPAAEQGFVNMQESVAKAIGAIQ